MEHLFLMFLDHTQQRSIVGRTLPDNTRHSQQTNIHAPGRIRTTISAGERPRCECRVLSGRGLCDELITRPEESYRLCYVVVCDLETS